MLEQIICPENCASALPAVVFDACAPEVRLSEYTNVAVGKADIEPFADWTAAGEWATRLSQSAVLADSIRMLTIRGNKPAPTDTVIELTKGRTIVTNKKHVLNFVIDEMNDANYDFARTLECGTIQFRIWPITDGGKELQGHNSGILVSAKASIVYDEGTGAIQKIVGTFEWNSKQSPARVLNPIAGF